MAKQFDTLEPDHQNFISEQHMFFIASAAADGRVNMSPKGMDSLCSFTTRPLILRVYGTARAINPKGGDWDELAAHFPPHRGARQIFDMQVDMVQTSCGWAVPFMVFNQDRDTMQKYIDGKSDQEFRDGWVKKNAMTIDGKPTGVFGT